MRWLFRAATAIAEMGKGGCIMRLARIRIENFRNFQELDVTLGGNVVSVGENRVGKSNLLFALRLIFDPSLPDSGRQLRRSDFWDGLQSIDADSRVRIFVEIEDFEDDQIGRASCRERVCKYV